VTRLEAAQAGDVFLGHAGHVGERGCLAAKQRHAGAFESSGELVAVAIDVLVNCLLDDLGLLEADSEQAFQDARAAWRAALRVHVLAPPDAGFSARLASLAAAADKRAAACEAAYKNGFEWPAARGGAKPPYELQPGSGRPLRRGTMR
jgi:hypothetical protein